MLQPRPIVVLGPTAGGKSALAVELAERLPGTGAEVINADSMQVYRHLDAGTAKPSPALRGRIRHHLIDIVEPTEPFTVHDWVQQAQRLIDPLQQRGAWPVMVGGTNLYLTALLEGLFEGPGPDVAFRQSVKEVEGVELRARLRRVDPAAADRIAPNDRKRLIRAIEVHHLTGEPISKLQAQWSGEGRNHRVRTEHNEQPDHGASPGSSDGEPRSSEKPYRFNPILIGLRWPTELINQRINHRVKAMFYPEKVSPDLTAEICPHGASLVEETRRLHQANWLGTQAREALGYKQVLDHLAGRCSLDEAFERTKILTRRFAKQQRTWLRRYRGVHWIDAAEVDRPPCPSVALSIVETALA